MFLHGNPTSSYLWRNVIPHVAAHRRGASPRPDRDGRLRQARRRRARTRTGSSSTGATSTACFDRARPRRPDVTLVVHDWGSALGFDWARRHRDRVAGIAYMEAIVRPVTLGRVARRRAPVLRGASARPPATRWCSTRTCSSRRSCPASILRTLGDDEMAEYRRPFAGRARTVGRRSRGRVRSRSTVSRPTSPTIVQAYADWLVDARRPQAVRQRRARARSSSARQREFCRTWPNQTEVTVAGNHFIQEDSPDEIGAAIAAWLPCSAPERWRVEREAA